MRAMTRPERVMRAMTRPERVGEQTDILGESPIWNERDQALYWVDIRRPAIRRLDYASGRVDSWGMPDLTGSIAFVADDRLLVALPDKIALFDLAAGALTPIAHMPERIPGHRFNDGRCDRQGRFWAGTMHNATRAPEGVLYRLDAAGLAPVLRGICIPNSLAWSPDGRTMYFADSLQYAIFAYDYDPGAGEISGKRVFAKTEPPGFPDGSAVDAEGCLWNAEFNAGRIVRYAPDGRIDRVIPTPVPRPTSCAFGGPNLDILYITTTSQHMTQEEREAMPLAGSLLAVEPGVRGLPEPRFIAGGH
jgi:sugar lactone lactonase YvrE